MVVRIILFLSSLLHRPKAPKILPSPSLIQAKSAIAPRDEAGVVAAREKLWAGFDALANALDAEGEGNYHFVRCQVTYADMEVAALLYFISRISSERIWAYLKDRNGGRWQKLVDEFKPYLPVL